MNTLRGQVRKHLLVALRINQQGRNQVTSQTLLRRMSVNGRLVFEHPSPNMSLKDKVQLAAILRGKNAWAKDKLKQAKAMLRRDV